MPRNAAKKTNKNTKRLPVLTKLTNINKRKKVNTNTNNSSKNKNKNINNNTTSSVKNTKKKKEQQKSKNIKAEKAAVNKTFTRLNKINNNCDANITISTTSVPEKLLAETTVVDTAAVVAFKKHPIKHLQQQQQQHQQPLQSKNNDTQQKNILKYFVKNLKSIKLADIRKSYGLGLDLKKQKTIFNIKLNKDDIGNVIKNRIIIDNCKKINNKQKSFSSIKSSDICKTETETTTETATTNSQATLSTSPSLVTPTPCTSITSSISSLYPIVIEITDTLQHQQQQFNNNNNNIKHNETNEFVEQQQEKQQQEQIKAKNLNSKKRNKKLHSNYKNLNKNNNTIKYSQTAVNDTLKQQQKQLQQQQHKSQQNTYNNNNTISKQNKQSTQITTVTKATSSSSSSSLSLASSTTTETTKNQSQEVKARLATLRIRKKVLQQQQQEPLLNKTTQKGHKTTALTTSTSSSFPVVSSSAETCTENDSSSLPNYTGKKFIKRAPALLDEATLNLIETLNDNEIKKPNNKRKHNTTAALLSLASLHQPRPKRIAANWSPDKSAPSVASGAGVTTIDRSEHKQTAAAEFFRPLPIETTKNTNSKKRARIMSLYERPFQTTNDGRGSVINNGYMTSSRSSASSGGVGGGALVINDVNDAQEMANQYYLSGSSGSGGITSNSNSSLVGNGSVMNHVPTMGTLCNIGNTCYLNSVVYTLRFAPQFLHNLHHLLSNLNALQQNIARARAKSSSLGRGMTSVHMENARSWSSKDLASMEQYGSSVTVAGTSTAPVNAQALTHVTQKSSHQLLTEKLHDLYQSLHRNEINESTEPHHADTLLHAIQEVSSIFEGNQQQDAHEFLMCLLNSIRETSQTLIKAIAECPDVILNGYISNPDEIESDLMKNHAGGISGGVGIGGNTSNSSSSLASTTLSSLTSSKSSLFFSRKSKRKDESKSSKNSRLQSPLKDALMSGGGSTGATTTANSLFYLNTNDLNSSTSPASSIALAGGSGNATTASGVGITSPSSSSPHLSGVSGGDETDATMAVALLLKDKQRLECKIRELGLDFFNEDFEGITVSTTKCLSCETITEQKETMIDIAVPVPQAGYESNEFMDRPSSFIQNSCITREYFRNENKYRCEQCCGYTEAIRSISYEVLPRLLIIQLSRFSGGMEKINSYIPTSFTLQCFCSKCCQLNDANKLHIYKLYSVITHVGATMSVGHYIAYTCSLDWANEYINCPKEQRRRASQERNLSAATGNGSTAVGGTNNSGQSVSSSGLGSSSNSFIKMKMKFGRSKASSSGDMSKNVKQLNGLNSSSSNSKGITNGIGKLTMNSSGGSSSATPQCPTTCQSINCCAMRLTAQQQLQYQSANSSTSDFSEESSQYYNGSAYNNPANYNNNINHGYNTTNNISASTNTSGYGSAGRGSTKASYATQNNCNEPIWYMCDDDKIKAMTQREFEDLLSPARKITITPYLLFYARYNLQSTPPKSATVSTSSPGPVTSSPQTSWSNESLQSSGHSAHSSGVRM